MYKKLSIFLILLIFGNFCNSAPEVEKMSLDEAWKERLKWVSIDKNHTIGIAGIKTKSMAPYINGGEWIFLKKINSIEETRQIKINDVVIISRQGYPKGVCHTVTDVSKTHIKTQGLNNMFSDGWGHRKLVKSITLRVIKIE